MQTASFASEVGVTPLFRNLTRAAREALGREFVPLEVEHGPLLVAEEGHGDVFILGEGVEVIAVDIIWEGDEPWQAVSRLRRGAVIGSVNLRGGAMLAHDSGLRHDPRQRFEVVQGGTIWRLPARRIPHVLDLRLVGDGRNKGFQPKSTDEFIEVMHKWEWIGRSPDATALVPRERLELAQAATIVEVQPGQVLQRAGDKSGALTLLGPGAAVKATHADLPENAPYWVIGRGGMYGYGVMSHRVYAPITLTCAHGGQVLQWDRKTLRKLGGGAFGQLRGSWIDTFLNERMAIYEAVLPVAAAMSQSPLLRALSIGQVLALLQGSTLVDWRVGGAPPVPIGVKAGMGVVVDGEVVGYRLLPTVDHNSVQMLRFDPTSVCRGVCPVDPSRSPFERALEGAATRAFGSEECARLLLGVGKGGADEAIRALPTHRWRARVPSRTVFVSADRIGEVFGVKDGEIINQLPEAGQKQARQLLDNARAIEARHHQAVEDRHFIERLDTGIGIVRDGVNLVWLQGATGQPLQARDVHMIEAMADVIAGPVDDLGFEERCLLVTLVDGADDAPLPEVAHGRMVVKVELQVGVDPVGRLDALLRASPGFSNVFLWADKGCTVGRRIAHLVDSCMLISWDPQAGLPSEWPVETPYLYAQMVRTQPGYSLPATAVRVHPATEEGGPARGWNSRHAALARWARAATRRQIGIALGGGGAWGWAHVALLRAAYARRIPIDVVSGASFGSVAGAFFAIGGPVGLRYAIKHDRDIQRAVNLAMATGEPLESYIDSLPTGMATWGDEELKNPRFARNIRALVPPSDRTAARLPPVPLTHLPIPFFPVATELTMGSEHPRLRGSVGRGVRASGSLPPVFPVLREPGGNYADGGLSQNVPANVVETEGVAIIVASNIVPPPFLQDPRPVRSGVRGLISSLNPVSRTISMAVGVQTLFNRSGAVDTSMAPVVFQSAWTGTFLSQIDRADEIVSDTMANQQFWQAMDGLRSRWQAVRRPRPGICTNLGEVRAKA